MLDLDTRQLTRDGRERHLSPKAFELLALLVEERPKALSKSSLQQRLWPDTFVEEANLSNLVAEIRAALDDPAREPRYLRTAHRFGYAFCGDASSQVPSRSMSFPAVRCWLEWGTTRFPLPAGEHVIGRDADVAVRIDAATVSRRHAKVVVTDVTILEDFGSKNGTFHREARVTAPVRLQDGDELRIGSQRLVFHARGGDSTETQTEAGA